MVEIIIIIIIYAKLNNLRTNQNIQSVSLILSMCIFYLERFASNANTKTSFLILSISNDKHKHKLFEKNVVMASLIIE